MKQSFTYASDAGIPAKKGPGGALPASMPHHLPKVGFRPDQLKAVIFDVDGTLYRQRPLQVAMLARLIGAHKWQPGKFLLTLRFLRAYRKAQENMRGGPRTGDIGERQLQFACRETGVSRDAGLARVDFWMRQQPLTILDRYLQPGLTEFLRACRERGMRLAVVSDYPADDKVKSLGLSGFFEVTVCAQAPAVDVFKPNPRGLEVALQRIGVERHAALYVGDRLDVDAEFATAAGVPCVIVGRRPHINPGGNVIQLPTYNELHHLIFS
jgi:HAD superfamily hydrolase (TIGR01549 family)